MVSPRYKRVALVGGGPAGLAAIRELVQEQCFDYIRVFERKDRVGEIWSAFNLFSAINDSADFSKVQIQDWYITSILQGIRTPAGQISALLPWRRETVSHTGESTITDIVGKREARATKPHLRNSRYKRRCKNDGSCIRGFGKIIFATGYKLSYPVLPFEAVTARNQLLGSVNIYLGLEVRLSRW